MNVPRTSRAKANMILMMLSLAVVVGTFSPVRAAAPSNEQWKYLGVSDKGTQFYYDAASVMYLSKDLINVWIREVTPNATPIRRLREINCAYRVIRDREVVAERIGGKTAPMIDNKPSAWHAMEKNPVTVTLYKAICK